MNAPHSAAANQAALLADAAKYLAGGGLGLFQLPPDLNLVVARVLPEQNLILLRGAVPGAIGGLLVIRKSVKQTKAQQQKVREVK